MNYSYCEVIAENDEILFSGYSESRAFNVYLIAVTSGKTVRMTVDGFLWHVNDGEY